MMNSKVVEFSKSIFNRVYTPLLYCTHRYLVLVGGAGSGKSVFCAQKVLVWLLQGENERILLVRKVAKTIRQSQYQLIKSLIYQYGLGSLFRFKDSELNIKCVNGNELLTFGLDDQEKIKSIYGITKVWIEEATELTETDFTQIDLRLRGRVNGYFQILLSFNPIDEFHWLNGFFFLRRVENAYTFHTTYKDNRFIDPEYKKILEGIRDPNLRRIYLEGKWGILQNIIYQPYLSVEKFPDRFDDVFYGLDFGYNNPSALIEIGVRDKEFYLRELLYETELTNADLIERMNSLGVDRSKMIYADSAEPQRIEEIRRAGYIIEPADKSVKDGIDYCQRQVFYTLPENINLNKERQSYKWRETKDGRILDEPEKFRDHLMDAKRYGVYTHYHRPIVGAAIV
ncbi:MAG: PBSX family phage terminase large subunit [candidate division KSB1 bacterium]|nr:PBSX family phage terminase large subunit [candidate division KSB1 bacterium]